MSCNWFEHLNQTCSEGIVVVTDTNIAQLALFQQMMQYKDNILAVIVLPAGESSKSWSSIEQIITTLSQVKASRKTVLVSIGGGMICDLAGFAAAIYRRGMKYQSVPTTLLAQIDAAIGGKNGINTETAKNVIGTFYHPQHIVIDPAFLDTLPEREFKAGLAEMIKYGLILDAAFFKWIEENLDLLLAKQADILVKAITRCVEIKNEVVAQDEKEEKGVRQLLNFGHTLGHAIEATTQYTTFLHGEAVAIGMSQAARLSYKKGFISENELAQIILLLQRCDLPTELPVIEKALLIEAMQQDKKNHRAQSHIVLLKSIGNAVLQAQNPVELI
jgi:3-dehydroquinate synthase